MAQEPDHRQHLQEVDRQSNFENICRECPYRRETARDERQGEFCFWDVDGRDDKRYPWSV